MKQYRARFPLLASKTYLNSCSYGALADSVSHAISQYLSDRREYGARWEQWGGMLEDLRGKTARLVGSDSGNIAITPTLSAAFNAFVSCLDFTGERREVVATSYDFPTTAQIWHAQKQRGAEIRVADLDDAEDPMAEFERLINERTLVVSIPWVCYRNGRKLDVRSIADLARSRGALVAVDAYQGVGSMACNAAELGADVLLGGYLKYLLGTSGLAYMYVRDELLETLHPTTSGWFAQEDVHAMAIADNSPAQSARRFEGGTPSVPGLYACNAGLDLVAEVGITTIEERIRYLTQRIRSAAKERGWQLATGDGPNGAMLAVRSTDMFSLVEKLANEGVIVSCRDQNIRISPHFYNDDGDLERLFAALDNNSSLLA